jgi:hypothetical protein
MVLIACLKITEPLGTTVWPPDNSRLGFSQPPVDSPAQHHDADATRRAAPWNLERDRLP